MMSAAQLQLWARNDSLTRTQIEDALWKSRTLVKTHLMRRTLHLIASSDFWLYISALRRSRTTRELRVMQRCNIAETEAREVAALIVQTLEPGPMTANAIRAAVQPKVSRRVREWMKLVWSIMQLPVAEGLVCYGSGDGNEATYIRSDQWLKGGHEKRKDVPEQKAQLELLRRYLRAYGPARIKDFIHWSGITAAEAAALLTSIQNEVEEVAGGFLLREDVPQLRDARSLKDSVHLLPHFDVFLLAHSSKDHLLDLEHYKHVYRNQGWISPVVLIGGRIAGTWKYTRTARDLDITISAFEHMPRPVREKIQYRAERLASYFGKKATLSYGCE